MHSNRDTWGFLVADVSRLLRRAFERQMGGTPLSFAQARALYYISRHEGVRQVDLAELLELQPIRLARHIDVLEKLKLVERRPAPDDRRAYHIYLRPAAHEVLSEFESTAKSIRATATKGLNTAQVEALHAALGAIRGNLHGI
ncbi:MAG: MarR family transcriptional regulator [Alphaproteobacteria bacterium]|nr:MarR family transcriptional regulator [Alphaproteobacteria bacterium]